ncbi:PPOX class F420-dependent oxidoreductase [Amycolatopsis sp. NPDC059090]|uniref:PPOX class F420-dependent oxidoreductase n=1 Tax=unclassified Amycolatopsis TaxID=2618356 RepID=UPI00366E4BE9
MGEVIGVSRRRKLEYRCYASIQRNARRAARNVTLIDWDTGCFDGYRFCLVMTRRRAGDMVATPVWFAEVGGRLCFRTAGDTGKVRRVRSEPEVWVAPCSIGGKQMAPFMVGISEILCEDEAMAAEAALQGRYGLSRRVFEILFGARDAVYIAVSKPDRVGT